MSASPHAQDAIALLKEDHAKVRDLLSQLEETTSRGVTKRAELLAKIAQEVNVHAQIEEEIFYPAFQKAAEKEDDSKLFFEAVEEHGLVKVVLPDLQAIAPDTAVFGAKGKVLKDLIEHHAEEEEKEMFPRAKKLLGKDRLLELGEALAARKQELLIKPTSRAGARAKSQAGRVATSR